MEEPIETPHDPLIVTARFDGNASVAFQRLREAHFPRRLDRVPAHCTLFHHLPGEALDEVVAMMGSRCAATVPAGFATTGLRFLGRGVALLLRCPPLVDLRRDLAGAFATALTPQDRQPYHPHVTIQNKADPGAARALFDRLTSEGSAVAGTIVGLDLWHYRGGPWEAAGRFSFSRGAGDGGAAQP